MALRAKQLFGLRPIPPRDKLEAEGWLPSLAHVEVDAPRQNEGGSNEGSWTIRGAQRSLQHAQQDGTLPALQTAVSIQPILEGGSPPARSSDAQNAFGAALTRSRTPLARSRSRASVARSCSPGARGRSPAGLPPRSAADSPLPTPPDSLVAVMQELDAVGGQAAKQAAVLKELEGCCNGARRQVYKAAVQLAQCKEERERDERAIAEAEAAAQRFALQTEQQVAALQLELLSITNAAAAQRRRLDAGARAAERRAEGLDAAAASCQQAAATWKHRYTLMAASHQPLSAAERRRADEEMEEWRNRGA
ncbi:centrosomal of 131 kDa [Micractinium conductrix]|uniref:Centrosomal of 131 kDa n=1 Tax=Micractinium conductrix TaxID=554055 RepID=A0A2P6VE69_9CHLO|nr:centrosomal of 131 kDa [Micractinium conductrix]|eukprot:PSC72386.1 centrosomal of 131 kDa [Micractinium conductrix]